MRAELRDSLEFLYPDSPISPRLRTAMALDAARGSTASVHILLRDLPPGQPLRFTVRSGGKAVPQARWFRLVDVPVEKNTGPVGFIEKEGEKNLHAARRAPFRVFDAMEPVDGEVAPAAPTAALRLHLPAFRRGTRDYDIALASDSGAIPLRLTVNTHRTWVPPVGRESLPYTNWFATRLMAERHGLEPWSEAHWRMIRRYADLMARARQNTFWVPLADMFSHEAVPVLDKKRLRRFVKTFLDAGLYYIEGGHLAGRTGGEWRARTFDVTLSKTRATTPEGNAALQNLCRQLMEEIRRHAWQPRWLQHVTDEPTADNATDYRILTGMVRRHMPGLPILDATMDPSLAGAVDIWCPQAQEYQAHREAFETVRAAGDKVWFYTCCFPGGPWLNRLLDEELLRPALFGWGAAWFQLDGFLHWGLNHYKPNQDPFQVSVVDHGGGNFLPAGDTHVVYPGPDGPWSSVRLEAQREGFEDFELLRILRGRRPGKVDRIIRGVFRAFDDYTKDTKVFRTARRRLLEALDG